MALILSLQEKDRVRVCNALFDWKPPPSAQCYVPFIYHGMKTRAQAIIGGQLVHCKKIHNFPHT